MLLTIAVCIEPGRSGSQGVRIFLSCWQSQTDSEAVDVSRDTFSDRGPLSLRGSRSNQVRSSWFHSQECASSGQDFQMLWTGNCSFTRRTCLICSRSTGGKLELGGWTEPRFPRDPKHFPLLDHPKLKNAVPFGKRIYRFWRIWLVVCISVAVSRGQIQGCLNFPESALFVHRLGLTVTD